MSGATKRPVWMWLLLVGLPLWLVASAFGALWYYFHKERAMEREEQVRFAQAVSIPLLEDDLKKFVEVIGERNGSSEEAARNLTRAASMIEGVLGPTNTGYAIRREQGPAEWPILHATLPGKDEKAPAVWLVTSYDSAAGSRGAEANASGASATLAAAQALAQNPFPVSVHFVFLPHANDPEAPWQETAARLSALIRRSGPPRAVLCVEAMGQGESLWLTSRDLEAKPLGLAEGLGTVVGAEVVCLEDDVDLASVLFETGLPAVRVATGPMIASGKGDERIPFPPTVASSTGRLIELVRRCAFSE